MPYFLAPLGNAQSFDSSGNPLVGGSWKTFLAGTTTPATTFTSQAGTVQQGTTMTLDAMGLPVNGPVWMLGAQALKFRLSNASGVQLDEWDNISGIGDTNATPDEWVLFPAAPTYVGATVFTLAGDQTNIFQVKRRLKSTNTGGLVYSTIVSSVYTTVTTVTVTNTSGVLDAGLSAVSYGLLAANNTSVPSVSGRLLRITRFSTAGSGTWTKPTDTVSVLIKTLGAGGGGGGSPTGVTSGGGGGAGAYSELYIASSSASYAYVVGAGGSGGATSGAGGSGSLSTIAAITATGGGGGTANNGQGGLGGAATGGTINVDGGAGVSGNTGDSGLTNANGGTGGSSFYGGAGRGNSGTGAVGVFGGGGGGSGPLANGGVGGAGYIEIMEYA